MNSPLSVPQLTSVTLKLKRTVCTPRINMNSPSTTLWLLGI